MKWRFMKKKNTGFQVSKPGVWQSQAEFSIGAVWGDLGSREGLA